MAIMMIVLGSAFSMASLFMPWENSEQAALAPALGAFIPALGVGIAIAMYVMIIVGSFINAAFMHIFVYIVGGRKGYTSTFNAMAYASTPSLLLGWIPVVNIITGIWALVLEVKGIRTLHEITTGKAILAILLPVIILLGIVGASVGLLFGFMSAAGS
ncbi:MAG: YIP1 family protein [Candidatus Aenigmatarchaeota archaeon]